MTRQEFDRYYAATAENWEGTLQLINDLAYEGAAVKLALKSGAALSGADLRYAALRGADLRDAALRDADLSGADLRGADLRGAALSRARGIQRERCIDLLMLLDQPGAIRAYTLVTADLQSPIHSTRITYAIGQTYEEPNANTDDAELCGEGLHVATLPWCLREYRRGHRILIVEFTAADIACIPTCTDGKFRLRKFTVVGEKDISALVAKKESA